MNTREAFPVRFEFDARSSNGEASRRSSSCRFPRNTAMNSGGWRKTNITAGDQVTVEMTIGAALG